MADRVGITIELIGKDAAISGLQQVQSLVNQLNGKSAKVNVDASGISRAQSAVSNLFTTVGSVSKGIGGMLTTTSSLMSRTGGMLTRISNTFGGSILRKASWYAVGKGVRMVEEGINDSVSRFDTMRTFPKLMERLGISAAKSADIVENKLNNAVLGLPTALNEIVDTTKSLTMLYGDIDKGSDLAIAANNAFLAAGSDEMQVYYGMKQIRDILAKGSLRSMEWDSLFAALGTSTQVVGEAMGYSADKVGEFQTALREGDIEARKFLDALIQVGATEGSELWERAGISKDTISSRLKNIKNAFSILGKEALEAFDKGLEENAGGGLPDQILKISDAIKTKLSPAVSGWVEENADEIIGFFGKLQSFNWGKLASSVVDNAGKMLDFFGGLASKVGEDNIIKFVAFATTWAGPLGKALSLLASPIGLAGTLFTKFGRMMGKAGKFIGRGGGALGGGIAGGMAGYKQSFAFLGEIAAIGALIAEFAKVAEVVGNVDLGNFEGNIGKIADVLAEGGVFAGLLTTVGTLASKAGLGGAVLAGEGLTLGFEGLMGGFGLLVEQFAGIAQKINNLNLTNFDSNWDKFLGFFKSIAKQSAVETGIGAGITGLTGGMGALVIAAGEALAGLETYNLSEKGATISQFVDIAQEINDAEFPTDTKLERMGSVIESIASAFDKKIDIDNAKIDSINNALEAVKGISRDMYAFENIANADVDVKGASDKITEIVSTLGEISQTIAKDFPETSWESGEQSNIAKNMMSVLDSINKTIPIFNDIQKSIDGIGAEGRTRQTGTTTVAGVTSVNREYIRDKFQGTIDQINEIVAGMQDISNQITPSGSIIAALHERIKSSIQDNIIKNYSATMAQINGLAAVIGATDPSEAGIGTAPQGARDLFDRKREQISKLLDGVQGIMEDVGSKIPVIGTALKWYDSAVNKGILNNLEKSMGSIRDIMVKTNLAMATMNRVDMESMPDFKENVTQFMSDIKDIVNAFSTGLGLSENAAGSGTDLPVMATNLQAIADSMESVKSIVSAISEMSGELESITSSGEGDRSATANLAAALSGLQTALTSIPEDAEDIQERALNLKSAIESVNSIMQSLAGMQENIALVQENGTDAAAGGIIQSLIGALSGEDLAVTTESITALSGLIANIGTDLNTLGEVDLSGISSAVQELYGNLDTLKGSLDNVASALQEVASNADTATGSINTLASTASGRASAFSPLIGALSNLSGQLSDAAGAADALTGAINSIPSYKSVTVAYTQVGSPGPVGGGGGTFLAATGGLVPQYRAFGGSIFKPRGTDTVPAMLTPGEYIIRKKAVDHFGVPFLRALNALNIPSAIDRMVGGLRTPSGYGMVTHDNRRIYNNNQKINQYISTNNPSYANRRANRYARSL